MFRRILVAALIAGAVAGFVATAVQVARLLPLIEIAETFEAAGASHQHDHGVAAQWQPTPGGERLAFTLLFNVLAGVGFALLVNAGLALRKAAGHAPTIGGGVIWGAAGFASFALAPALGLPPELPGTPAADLLARQAWWIGTAVATAGGLGILAHAATGAARRGIAAAAGLLLIALPHLIGAPEPPDEHSAVSAELAVQFAVASLAAAAVFWAVLGSMSGWLQRRLG